MSLIGNLQDKLLSFDQEELFTRVTPNISQFDPSLKPSAERINNILQGNKIHTLGVAQLVVKLEDQGDSGEPIFAIYTPVINFSVEQNGYRAADRCTLSYRFTNFPVDPRLVKSMTVVVYMMFSKDNIDIFEQGRAEIDPHSQESPLWMLFKGDVDNIKLMFEDELKVEISARDPTAILLETSIEESPAKLREVLVKNLKDVTSPDNTRSIKSILEAIAATYRLQLPKELDTLLETKPSTSIAPEFISKNAFSNSSSIWEVLSKIATLNGFITFIHLDVLYFGPSNVKGPDRSLPNQVPKRTKEIVSYVWGKNIAALEINRELFIQRKFQGVIVTSWDEQNKRRVIGIYPKIRTFAEVRGDKGKATLVFDVNAQNISLGDSLMGGKVSRLGEVNLKTQLKTVKKGAKFTQAEKKLDDKGKQTGNTGAEKSQKQQSLGDYMSFVIPGIAKEDTLDQIAKKVFGDIHKRDTRGNLEVRGNPFLFPGTEINVHTLQDLKDFINKHGLGDSEVTLKAEFQKTAFHTEAVHDDLKQLIEKATEDLIYPFYVETAEHSWDSTGSGYTCRCNFINVIGLKNPDVASSLSAEAIESPTTSQFPRFGDNATV